MFTVYCSCFYSWSKTFDTKIYRWLQPKILLRVCHNLMKNRVLKHYSIKFWPKLALSFRVDGPPKQFKSRILINKMTKKDNNIKTLKSFTFYQIIYRTFVEIKYFYEKFSISYIKMEDLKEVNVFLSSFLTKLFARMTWKQWTANRI